MLNFQEMISKLTQFWAEQGCLVHQGYDLEVGAGTFNPATFLRCLGPEPYSAVYVEPSRRPQDGRYGENPNRVQFYHQMQVIIKPSPLNIQELYLKSLEAIGLKLTEHDIRFVHDDWENPTIGAWGLGWEVWADGMEVTQFTYFQAVGGIPCKPVSSELTYGLERLAMYIQGVDSMFDLMWNDQVKYGEIYKRSEWEWSHYNFTQADTKMWGRHFEDFEIESNRLIDEGLPIPAYDFVMKASHAFNLLDARGVISVTERAGYMARIRNLARRLAENYVKSREAQAFPLLRGEEEVEHLEVAAVSTGWDPSEQEDFLLEIGSEELPATFVPVGMANLREQITHFLKEHSLSFEAIELYGTPRRLAAYVKNLAGGTETKTTERKGPALKSAFDSDGALTKAGAGFLRSLNLEAVSLQEVKEGAIPELEIRNDYLFATVEVPGKSTRELLAEALPTLIIKLDFPKKMRWANFDIEYARPLQWIVALYGKEVVPFVVGNLVSGRQTQGHRFLSPEPLSLKEAKGYVDRLRKKKVLVDVKEREQSILEEIKKAEKLLKGEVAAKERVMPQVLHLAEWPLVTVGNFDERYLKAPKEVLISEMVEHQKYFPVVRNGELLPHFLIVCNIKPTDLIRAGNEKALSPRLADGMFLFEEDLKVPLQEFNEKLKHVTFQKALGSMWDKVERLQRACKMLHSFLPICDVEKLLRAATFCKTDLASELVGEFPELQGVIGRIYALKHGEDPEVAQAIDEHWMPRGDKDQLPESGCGKLLSLAEKFDNLLCCFVIGLTPTSSSDPYALRRQGFGLLQISIENKLYLPLKAVLNDLFSFLSIDVDREKILGEIEIFLINRLRTLFLDYGFAKDEIEAVFAQGLNDPYDLYRKIETLADFRKKERELFEVTCKIHTRVKKILLSQKSGLIPGWLANRMEINVTTENRFPPVDPELFKDESEKDVYKKVEALKEAFHLKLVDRRQTAGRDYRAAFTLLAELQEPVANLFDRVKILDDENRLSLLQEIWDLCEELIDFSEIQVKRGDSDNGQ